MKIFLAKNWRLFLKKQAFFYLCVCVLVVRGDDWVGDPPVGAVVVVGVAVHRVHLDDVRAWKKKRKENIQIGENHELRNECA